MSILSEIEALHDYSVEMRRELHRHPELSHQEEMTAKLIEEELDKDGIPHRRSAATGVIAEIRGKGEGKTILLRADIDALPITEKKDREYASENEGVMHACGHDAHTAILLTAAKVLSAHRGEFNGTVRLCFQPAEEMGKCAKDMIADGALDGVTRVFGLHTAPDLPCGTAGIKKGSNNASVDAFHLKIKGLSAHVASPHKGVDAVYILSQIIVSLQALVSRRSDPVEPLVIGVGKISGGTVYNIVAGEAEAEGTLRSSTRESRKRFIDEMTRLSEEIARLYGGEASISWEDHASPLVNHEVVCDELVNLLSREAPYVRIVTDRPMSMTGDNFSEFIQEVPGAYAYLGTSNPEKPDTLSPYHSCTFDIDEDCLKTGTLLHVLYALWYLES